MLLVGLSSGRCRDCGGCHHVISSSSSSSSSSIHLRPGAVDIRHVQRRANELRLRIRNLGETGQVVPALRNLELIPCDGCKVRDVSHCGLRGLQLRVVLDANDTTDGALPSISDVSKKLGR